MSKAVKLLVCAFESSGKSTITSGIDDVMVVNGDAKEYGFSVPHFNVKNYAGMEALIGECNAKIGVYKEKFGKLPGTVVFDTVTQIYTAMQKFNGDKFTGFNIHSANNKDTLMLNDYIENTLIANGINVVIVAHTTFDPDTSRHIIPASGQFAKAGSWLSVVNDAMFIEKKNSKLVVHHKTMKYPCRSTLSTLKDIQPVEEYNINEHLKALSDSKIEAEEFIL